MVSQFTPLPLFWDLMGVFLLGLIVWLIIWPISRSLAWFAAAAGAGVLSTILILAFLFRLSGSTRIDSLDDLLYTLVFWLSIHLVSMIAFLRRIQRQQQAQWPEEILVGHNQPIQRMSEKQLSAEP